MSFSFRGLEAGLSVEPPRGQNRKTAARAARLWVFGSQAAAISSAGVGYHTQQFEDRVFGDPTISPTTTGPSAPGKSKADDLAGRHHRPVPDSG